MHLKDSTLNNGREFCTVCESWLKVSAFSKGSPICKACTDAYSQVGGWKDSSYCTSTAGYINLFIAIRDRAIRDSKEDDFTSYWIEQFLDVWESLGYLSTSDNNYNIIF